MELMRTEERKRLQDTCSLVPLSGADGPPVCVRGKKIRSRACMLVLHVEGNHTLLPVFVCAVCVSSCSLMY